MRFAAPPVASLFLAVLLWIVTIHVFSPPAYIFPSPSMVMQSLGERDLWRNLSFTAAAALAGFSVAAVTGSLLGALFNFSPLARRSLYPYAIALKTTPVIAVAPLLVLWFKVGLVAKVAASLMVCFFPVLVGATQGFRVIDSNSLEFLRSLGASRFQIFRYLRWPSALPHLFSALKVAASLSIVGAIVGEFVSPDRGLGHVIVSASYRLETGRMFAAIVAAALVGWLFIGILTLLEWRFIRWAVQNDSA
jgi:NitT/TauT family transport system permease protein